MRTSIFFDQYASDELKEAAARGNYDGITDLDGHAWIECGSSSSFPPFSSKDLEPLFAQPETLLFIGGTTMPKRDGETLYDNSIPVFSPLSSWKIDEQWDQQADHYARATKYFVGESGVIGREKLASAIVERDSLLNQLLRVEVNLNKRAMPGFRTVLQAWFIETTRKLEDGGVAALLDLRRRASHIWNDLTSGVEFNTIATSFRMEESSAGGPTPCFLVEPILSGLSHYVKYRDSILSPAARVNSRWQAMELLIAHELVGRQIVGGSRVSGNPRLYAFYTLATLRAIKQAGIQIESWRIGDVDSLIIKLFGKKHNISNQAPASEVSKRVFPGRKTNDVQTLYDNLLIWSIEENKSSREIHLLEQVQEEVENHLKRLG